MMTKQSIGGGVLQFQILSNLERHFQMQKSLHSQKIIKDLITYLKFLYNYEDATSLYRVLVNPIFSIPTKDIASLLNLSRRKNYTLFETLEKAQTSNEIFLSNETKEKIVNIVSMI